jgi:hypothetical protein
MGGAGIGVGASITLGGGAGVVAFTLGGSAATGSNGAEVCISTLGSDALAFAICKLGGPPSGMLKMARRLSTASSWAWQLSGDLSALTAMVRARRQWMILSSVLSVGTDKVGCWNVTVSDTMRAAVDVLITEKHL